MSETDDLLSTQRTATGLTMRLRGPRLNAAVAEDAKTRMKAAAASVEGPVTVDLSGVDFIDSSGLGALVALKKSLGPGRPLDVVNLRPFVQRVMALTHLDTILTGKG